MPNVSDVVVWFVAKELVENTNKLERSREICTILLIGSLAVIKFV